MNTKLWRAALACAAACTVGATSQAAIFNQALDRSAYITLGGLDWAWASPVAADGSNFGVGIVDLSFQAAYGWHLPTADELQFAPVATDFLFTGANVPAGGSDPLSGSFFRDVFPPGDAACAAAYFTNDYSHCDWGNAPGSGGDSVVPWWGQPGAMSYSESLVVRPAESARPGLSAPSATVPEPSATVPEPSSLALLAAALAAAGCAARTSRRPRRAPTR